MGVDKNRKTQQGLVDLVITPTLGLGWLVSEDLIDSYVVDALNVPILASLAKRGFVAR